MIPRKINFINELNCGDIIYFEVDENGEPVSPLLILQIQNFIGIVVYNISNNETLMITLQDKDEVYVISNIKNLIESCQTDCRWIGMEYGNYKLLIDIVECNIEIYDSLTSEWNFIEDEKVDWIDEHILLISLEEKLKFRINLNTLHIEMSNKHNLKFRPFYNYLIGRENQYVFNENDELELSDSCQEEC